MRLLLQMASAVCCGCEGRQGRCKTFCRTASQADTASEAGGGTMSVRQSLAKALGITVGRVSQLVKLGCPVDNLESALAWFSSNVKRKPKKEKIHRRKRTGRAGCVYLLMEEGGSPLKIGFSTEKPEGRCDSCQTGNPRKLYLATCRWHDNAEDIERELHLQFVDKQLCGEWFDISFCEAIKAIERYAGWRFLPNIALNNEN